ncbi:hypothetical protein Q4E93_15705 [Flavitalea sp. BT771]|uniref:hypothetical protein n=1 Tax=Flavitalea sp. BT771 TaxID=3063329 RepID=UPI0026E25511|nr:hypothetical protein [Flavitalea sp. BT771]MDO6432047.1 hypothetical protein [Flavitalea sp. BT771]MDV6220956.1 hypothetical protein [Flavitalea sp. BT771]
MNKKWLAGGVLIILLLAICSVYIFIPSTIASSVYMPVKCPVDAAFRVVSQKDVWERLAAESQGRSSYRLRNIFFRQVALTGGGDSSKADALTILPVPSVDSAILRWSFVRKAGANPFKRINQYRQIGEDKNEVRVVLNFLHAYLEKNENVYDTPVKDSMLQDTAMVTIRWESDQYPSPDSIYARVDMMRKYIKEEGAQITNYPMLNVVRGKNGRFRNMAAVPTDRLLKGRGMIFPSRFISWKILTGEVRGGETIVEKAIAGLSKYATDRQHTAMAIPFQFLVTERNREPDTLKWLTRVCLPVN